MARKRDIGPFKTARAARLHLGQKLGYWVRHTKPGRPMMWIHPVKGTKRAIVQRRKNGPWFIVKYPWPSVGLKVTYNP